MSVERRLRDGLQRSAATVNPDARLRLPEAIVRGQRRQRVRQMVLALTTVLVVAGIGGAAVELARSAEHPPSASPGANVTSAPYAAIAGTYTSTLASASKVVENNAMAGTWTLLLEPNGVLTLGAPQPFRDVPSGSAFKIEGDRFITDAFVNDPRCSNDVGVYRWRRSAASLTFVPITDTCAVRRTLFSAGRWHLSS
jgi:hypothetical protein